MPGEKEKTLNIWRPWLPPAYDSWPLLSTYPGAILGGSGSGTFCRNTHGETHNFALSDFMIPGPLFPSNQFYMRQEELKQTEKPRILGLNSTPPFNPFENFSPLGHETEGSYMQLFPLACYHIEHPGFLPMLLLQYSPNLDSSGQERFFPVANFRFVIFNNTRSAKNISLAMLWSNPQSLSFENTRPRPFQRGEMEDPGSNALKKQWSQRNITFYPEHEISALQETTGIIMGNYNAPPTPILPGHGTTSIAAEVKRGYHYQGLRYFDTRTCGRDCVKSLLTSNSLGADEISADSPFHSGSALMLSADIGPDDFKSFAFSFAWDLPLFHQGRSLAEKPYTRNWGTNGKNAFKISSHGVMFDESWRSIISRTHKRVHENNSGNSHKTLTHFRDEAWKFQKSASIFLKKR